MSEQIAVRSTDAPEWTARTTDKGDALLAKLAEGHMLEITRAQTGSGTVDASLLKQQTAVSSPKQTVTIHPVAYPEAKKCKLPITITNVGLASSYNATQIGVYANDPDEGEILFFLAQSADGGVSVKSEALQHGYTANFDFYVGFGDADGVSVTVDPSNSVTQEGMENYVSTAIAEAQQKTIRTGGTGAAYTATVPGITVLKAGVSFVMMPHVSSTMVSPTLDVNGLGAKAIRQPLTNSTGASTTGAVATWLSADRPIRVTYDGVLWKVDRPRPSATSLYGNVPIENGGTDADTVVGAQKNLQVAPAIESEEFPGCYYRMVDGEREWLNPPMISNTPYRTTERINGIPVFTILFQSTIKPGGSSTPSLSGATRIIDSSIRVGTYGEDADKLGITTSWITNANGRMECTIALPSSASESVSVISIFKYTKQ